MQNTILEFFVCGTIVFIQKPGNPSTLKYLEMLGNMKLASVKCLLEHPRKFLKMPRGTK